MSFHVAAFAVMAALATAVPAVAKTSQGLKIVTLGTSLTAKGGWQEPLRQALNACLNRPVAVVNLGKSGMSSQWGLSQIDKVEAENPDIVLVEFAANDAALNRFLPLGRSTANMARIVRGLKAGETKPSVYVMAMNPVSGLRGMMRPYLDYYEAAHGALARELGVGFIDYRPGWRKLSQEKIDQAIADGLHPDPQVAAEVMVPVLVDALAGSGCVAAKTE